MIRATSSPLYSVAQFNNQPAERGTGIFYDKHDWKKQHDTVGPLVTLQLTPCFSSRNVQRRIAPL